jgi:hypothetical protein
VLVLGHIVLRLRPVKRERQHLKNLYEDWIRNQLVMDVLPVSGSSISCERIFSSSNTARKRRPTWGQIGFKAQANLALGEGGDRATRFGIGVLFGEVDVLPGYEVDNVHALTGAGTDLGSDEGEWVRHVPESICTFRWGFWLAEGRF